MSKSFFSDRDRFAGVIARIVGISRAARSASALPECVRIESVRASTPQAHPLTFIPRPDPAGQRPYVSSQSLKEFYVEVRFL